MGYCLWGRRESDTTEQLTLSLSFTFKLFNCCCSVAQLCLDSFQPHGLQHTRLPCPSPSPRACFKLMSIESVMPSNHLVFCHLLLLLPSVFPSIRVFSSESVLCIRWPKYWSFSFSISPSNEYSGLISLRIDWLGLLIVQGTLKSLLRHQSSKISILQHSAFLVVKLIDHFLYSLFCWCYAYVVFPYPGIRWSNDIFLYLVSGFLHFNLKVFWVWNDMMF